VPDSLSIKRLLLCVAVTIPSHTAVFGSSLFHNEWRLFLTQDQPADPLNERIFRKRGGSATGDQPGSTGFAGKEFRKGLLNPDNGVTDVTPQK
jgi:hypothetical protein